MLTQSQVGIEVQELAECGEYQSVEVVHALDSGCGGVLQLRQVRRKLRSDDEKGFQWRRINPSSGGEN